MRVSPVPDSIFSVDYKVSAEFLIPIANKPAWVSSKTSQNLIIVRPSNEGPLNDPTINFVNRVGGVLGYGSTESRATVTFNYNHFTIGSQIIVKLSVDNTACDKDIEFF
jgi:hypothetical protein